MNSISNDFLTKYRIIEDVFEYQGLDSEKVNTYAYIEDRFQTLFQDHAKLFNLDN
ncbi:hypothetical protein U27_05913 [Candidatus Vecturithrix granuli]|uniref:Uncharacterized protein n=1 Tax=Vecturithrix granuli TaxID=1499967 RepID=A0A081C2Y3_VECG1|nr:hypothetical protein U27_05913 [Candidatus Vecturithrix granuli]